MFKLDVLGEELSQERIEAIQDASRVSVAMSSVVHLQRQEQSKAGQIQIAMVVELCQENRSTIKRQPKRDQDLEGLKKSNRRRISELIGMH